MRILKCMHAIIIHVHSILIHAVYMYIHIIFIYALIIIIGMYVNEKYNKFDSCIAYICMVHYKKQLQYSIGANFHGIYNSRMIEEFGCNSRF